MTIVKNKKGQFIVIAVMMIALMIISIGAIMYGAGTYYRYEQWEEYITVVEHVKINTIRLVQISLANYTVSGNNSVLKANLNQWQNDIRKVYPGYAIVIGYQLANGSQSAYGENINYNLGLASNWFANPAFSAANATITLNITSVGLTGYQFVAQGFLRVTILDAAWNSPDSVVILLAVEKEGPSPVADLEKNSFKVTLNGTEPSNVTWTRRYDEDYDSIIYEISCEDVSKPSSVEVSVVDSRGIKVIANSTEIS